MAASKVPVILIYRLESKEQYEYTQKLDLIVYWYYEVIP